MSGVFRNIDPPPPHPLASAYPPPYGAGGGHTRWVEAGWGVNSSEDGRHCSVLYICKLTQNCQSIMIFMSEPLRYERRKYPSRRINSYIYVISSVNI
jgi:hypothetical protein